ncbi:hypothetical protein J2W22_003675 [Sphingomonas kyeonggiensis]|nr:hypothetical protein [Sphingomonas kyeonggiensis]
MGQAAVFRTSFSPAKAGAQTCEFLRRSVARTACGTASEATSLRREREREGRPPSARPTATPQNAKGARHCCQAPCRRTAAVDPDGSSAWFRRLLHSRRQGHASFGSVVEAGRSPLTPKGSCGYQPRRPASSLRPGAGSRKPCWMLFLRSILPGPSASLARCFRLADLAVVRFPAPEAGHLRTRFREPGHRPFPFRPSRFEPHLRAAFCFQSSRAPPSSKPRQRLGGTSVSQPAGTSHPRTVPNAVSRRHLHRFRLV